jgi:hypothetical protein
VHFGDRHLELLHGQAIFDLQDGVPFEIPEGGWSAGTVPVLVDVQLGGEDTACDQALVAPLRNSIARSPGRIPPVRSPTLH